ncbi:MAG: hypothetical protein UIM24_02130 [Clostridia bacterium]|nr:hypothetical protein [Clostridia bacterium]
MKILQPGMAKQFLSVFLSHITAVLLLAAFMFTFVAAVMNKPAVYAAVSVLMSLMYFFGLYFKGSELARRDKLSYTTTSVYLLKGAVLSLPVIVWNFVLWLLYIFAWNFLTIDGQFFSFTGIFYNILYVVNTFMFSGLATIESGYVEWYAHMLIYIVPVVAVTVGYIAGMYDFSVLDKLSPYIYENKNK